jgi:predicted DCC family thiol-disulfide oxidoreductase YuxK
VNLLTTGHHAVEPSAGGDSGVPTPDRHLLLYDGVCGLCNWLVQLVLARDRSGQFHFAALQSTQATAALAAFGARADTLDTVYVVERYRSPAPRLLSHGRAALFVFSRLGGPWRAVTVLGLLPSAVLDWGYRLIAQHRYRLFGRYDACPLPGPGVRQRFIDQGDGAVPSPVLPASES